MSRSAHLKRSRWTRKFELSTDDRFAGTSLEQGAFVQAERALSQDPSDGCVGVGRTARGGEGPRQKQKAKAATETKVDPAAVNTSQVGSGGLIDAMTSLSSKHSAAP